MTSTSSSQPQKAQMECVCSSQAMLEHSPDKPCSEGRWAGSEELEKRTLVQAEMDRMKQLPAASAYATHRLRVLNKVMQLLSVLPQSRTCSEAEELELLFAGLSI